ncbi:DNA topoisomerase IB [Pseudanabaena sp. FACHB-2040]|uniref:DNA topoisomerase IB n=1 Tax=Pseudanabaena sp. FACHB-2040 TaxID=2692859 RepID=UPI0016825227|nr:DNA topoisomerase IB [Pseudanabaena sp. FACHB-2040]MBD2256355.1 DNA topoisomerase IB [Pseudanabaena sp. FACHB-2040]
MPSSAPSTLNYTASVELLVQVADPKQFAQAAGLRHVSDEGPGISRKRSGKGFSYYDTKGARIQNARERQRIEALRIPPAWQDVWICPRLNGHLLATGRDAKGRKQYLYHPDWNKIRNEAKFSRMLAFGLALPKIRERVDQDLRKQKLSREKVLAVVVRLLEETFIRIGNDEYAQKNRSFGLTTLRDRHVEITGSTLKFQFRGKHGIEHEIELCDRKLAKLVKRCRDIPGYELFQYYDEDGQRQCIGSEDVNSYLREITEDTFSAKDFRTWAGTVETALALKEIGPFTSKTQANRNIVQAIKDVAKQLGNRPSTCRKYYVHPAIVEAYENGTLLPALDPDNAPAFPDNGLNFEENAVLLLLEQACSE